MCSPAAEPQQGGAQQRPGGEVERPAPPPPRQPRGARAARAAPAARRGRPPAGRTARRRVATTWTGAPAHAARRWCAAPRGGARARARQRRRSARRRAAREAQRRRACCRPRCPARAGRGTRAAPGRTRAAAARRGGAGTGASGGGGGVRRRAAPPRPRPRAPPRSAPRTAARSGSSTPKRLAQARDHLGGEQRVAAEVEEVSCEPDPLAAEHLRPDPGEHLLGGVRGATYGRSAPRGAVAGAGSARRSTLPLAVSGRAVQDHERRRHHVAPAAAARRKARSSAAAAGALRRPAPRRRPAGVARRPRRRHHRRLAHRRVAGERRLDLAQLDAEAAHLDLVVDAAQELERRRPASQRARSPVR